MTCADVVGFHAFDHARHFLNATKRMLGIRSHTTQGGMISLVLKDREAIVTMSHVSVEPSQVMELK
jgi:trehalose-6-phosphate synthase